jgi:hypothetical protein
VLILVVALLACEADLALGACAIGLGLHNRPKFLTLLVTGGVALGFAIAVFLIWTLWFVAPGCIGDASLSCVGDRVAPGFTYLGLGALVQWTWMLGVAAAARRMTKKRQLAHVSG